MKKILAMLLSLMVVLSLAACAEPSKDSDDTKAPNKAPNNASNSATDPVVKIDVKDSAELINNIWNAVPEDKKFFAMGGDFTNPVDNAAGIYSLEDEGLSSTLLIPADQIANVDEAASLVHAMNLNNFTCGAFHVTGDKAAFVEAMHNAVTGNQWICGMPEKLIIAEIGEYVLVCFGINDAIAPFETALSTAYASANIKYNEAITG